MSIRTEAVRIVGEKPARRRRANEECQMKQYLLSVYQPDGDPPPPDFLAETSEAEPQRSQAQPR
jgi:hypothetical protein